MSPKKLFLICLGGTVGVIGGFLIMNLLYPHPAQHPSSPPQVRGVKEMPH